MKKEDTISLLVYALMIVIAILLGLFVIAPLFTTFAPRLPGAGKLNMLFAFLFVIIAIIFNVILIEVSHIIGAKIGGYKILSCNMLGICFYRNGEKWKVKFSNFDGLTGETKIAPIKENASPKAYALVPLFAYLIEFVICMVIFFVVPEFLKNVSPNKYGGLAMLAIIAMMLVAVGSMIELYNIFPAHLDSTTDGYRLVILSKKENVKAYNELMRIECAYAENKELNDMIVFDDITDFTTEVNLYSVYKLFKEKKIDEAEKILDKIITNKDKIHRGAYCSALAQKLYLVLLNKPLNDAKQYYELHVDAQDRRYIANDISMQSIRAYLLISSILDSSEHEARFAISRYKKALKRTLPGRIDIEKELYQIAINKVDEVHPEWRIKDPQVR